MASCEACDVQPRCYHRLSHAFLRGKAHRQAKGSLPFREDLAEAFGQRESVCVHGWTGGGPRGMAPGRKVSMQTIWP
jgi:hypothetical protein